MFHCKFYNILYCTVLYSKVSTIVIVKLVDTPLIFSGMRESVITGKCI